MSVNVTDLPDIVLLKIFSHITNIREKVRLLRVCVRFYEIGQIALKTQQYAIVFDHHCLYDSEQWSLAERLNLNWRPPLIPLDKLIRLAPRLTHFIDNSKRIQIKSLVDTDEENNSDNENDNQSLKPFHLTHIQWIQLHFNQKLREPRNANNDEIKLHLLLDDCPNLHTFYFNLNSDSQSRKFWNPDYQIPFSPNLKVFGISLRVSEDHNQPDLTWTYRSEELCNNFFGILDGQAPNLERCRWQMSTCYNLERLIAGLINKLATNCSKLRFIEFYFNANRFNSEAELFISRPLLRQSYNYSELTNLSVLTIEGVQMPILFWTNILSACPNLKFLVYDKNTRHSMMSNLINLYCPQVMTFHHDKFWIEYYKYRIRNIL